VTLRRVRSIAWVLFALTVASIPVSTFMLTRPLKTPLTTQDLWSVVGSFIGAVAFSLVGALILSRHPRHAIGWTFTLSGPLTGAAIVCAAYGELAATLSLPAGETAGQVAYVLLQTGIFLPLTLGLLLFPDGRLLSRRWWPAAAAAVVGLVLRLVGDTMDPSGQDPFADGLDTAGVLLTVGSAIAGLAALAVRWRRADSILRQQLKWMTAAATLVVAAFVGDIAINVWDPKVIKPVEFLVFVVSYVSIPIAAGASILRYGLYEIDLIINRAIVYVSLTAILAGLYAGFTATLQKAFVAATGQNSDAAIVITVALIATLFTPVRNALQKFVDARFKDARDLVRVLSSLESDVGAVVDVIYGPRLAELEVPLRAGDQQLGRIALTARRHGAPYTQQERERLQRAADMVAMGLSLGRERPAPEVAAR
jgi:hypothetical protein